ncbi:protein FREE1-like [Cynara cardunculus var. scolymus]|uniref:protein FREE1-like n=1 Tax=Cynara cardunculus var. scolymus TaxID=59895 RepID=UPI000D62811D|nr:protein FREE1-like [Cynara cardunculus var. scolymus]
MHHQNEMNYPSSSYYDYHQSDIQNPIPNPPFDHFPTAANASAPPDPSIYHPTDYSNTYPSTYYPNDHQNRAVQNFDSSNPSYDPKSVPSWYYNHPYDQNQSQRAVEFGGAIVEESVYAYTGSHSGRQVESSKVPAVKFDDYGRPIGFADGGKNEQMGSKILKSDDFDENAYAYSGGNNGGKDRSSRVPALRFDDYGRPINSATNGGNEQRGLIASLDADKIVKGTPKVEVNEDVRSGVQKFRVMLLSEGGGAQGDMDVLCQIGLDGIQILDPATSRILKVYSLETVTRWEVLGSNIFAFWTKSSVDIEARRVRLKSNSYTTTNILDMVAAASFQLKEMDGVTISEQPAEKKKGFPDWKNLMKPGNEEKDHWVPDEASTKCTACSTYFGAFVRRHHCRNCGDIFCDKCTQGRIALTAEENAQQVRVCDQCMAEVTQRLSHVNEVAGRPSGFNRHEDLAKKLQEEMEKKRKTAAELKSNVADEQMKEVECPTCTVHLQVKVPGSGSKTIECSVCQHPFVVSAR